MINFPARNEIGIKLYITQKVTFLTDLVFEIQDLEKMETIFRGDVGKNTVFPLSKFFLRPA